MADLQFSTQESIGPDQSELDDQAKAARSRTRQARIREFLRRLEIAPTPFEVARVSARQEQAQQRHLQQRSPSPARSTGSLTPSSSRQSRTFRSSRSLMDLVS